MVDHSLLASPIKSEESKSIFDIILSLIFGKPEYDIHSTITKEIHK